MAGPTGSTGGSQPFSFLEITLVGTGDRILNGTEASKDVLVFLGSPGGNVNVIAPNVVGQRYWIQNESNVTVTFMKAGGGGEAQIEAEERILVIHTSAGTGNDYQIWPAGLP